MPDFIVRTQGLSKRYRIRASQGSGWRRNQRVLTEDISRVVRNLRRGESSERKTTFWALKDVSFEAGRGDIIGIIGQNGAGKSTLLKILGRVTEPTEGRIEIYGRVGSLLEVGTGFHSELTGRENIFISGAILGMSRAEIKLKFDEIVAFAGVEEFLDTPVKRFSSGMEVRLAFAVAAHLNPQVLLVDEVLSVGDAAFRQKSLAKIKEVSENGGTILFVSHNMTTVASLCRRALVLDHGRVSFPLGSVTDAIDHYLYTVGQGLKTELEAGRMGISPGDIRITDFGIYDQHSLLVETLTSGQPVDFRIGYEAQGQIPLDNVRVSIIISTLNGNTIANLTSDGVDNSPVLSGPTGQITCRVDRLPLAPGNISISLNIERDGQIVDRVNDVFVGTVDSGGHILQKRRTENPGLILMDQEWWAS